MMEIVAQQLWFTGANRVEIREQKINAPVVNEVLVKVICSAVSAGTEMLVYRGQLPSEISLDSTIKSLQDQQYPLQYGYACVGEVIRLGASVDESWLGKKVFAFQPHASYFLSDVDQLIAVPEDIAPENAVFLANMETAVNLMHDGKPLLGERVIILGQGIVGLFLTSLLAHIPLAELLVVDNFFLRRDWAKTLGATTFEPTAAAGLNNRQYAGPSSGADLIFELTGVPDALNLAIDLSGYHSRIIVGSWYGTKRAPVYLGGAAHRNRLQIITSQVSSIAPELSGRWDKARRFDITWEMIRRIQPSRLISHQQALADAPNVYQQLDEHPESTIQAIFNYR